MAVKRLGVWCTTYNLLRSPGIQVYTLHFGDVHAEVTVDAGAPDAQEYAQVP
jgi:hypothetical protein